MMPERVAKTDSNKQIEDTTGSGPFIFKKDEWKAGEKVVYVRNPRYKPRAEPPSMMAGGKVAKVDRVEWIAIPDANSAVNALIAGEIDLIEAPPADLQPLLRADKNVALFGWNAQGGQGMMRFNHLHPPFNSVKARQAAMYALAIEDLQRAQVGDPARYQVCNAPFICGAPYGKEYGDLLIKPDLDKARTLLKKSGYDGTPIVMLHTTDIAVLTNAGPIAKDLLEKGGFRVEMVPLDFQAIVSRRLRKTPASDGGWNGFMTSWLSVDMMNPLTNSMVTASCEKANFGWPCDAEVEKLRDAFARAPDAESRKKIATDIQARAVAYGTHIHLGQYTLPTATRGLAGVVTSPIPVFWGIEKK
jgi:peptide/nickel transport system substrate-binding protein